MHYFLKNKVFLLAVALITTIAYAGSRYGNDKKNNPRINHVFLSVSNLDSSIAFYLNAFDFKVTNRVSSLKIENGDSVTQMPLKLAFLKFAGHDLALELSERSRPVKIENNGNQIFQHIGIEVADISTAFKRLEAAGGKPMAPIRIIRTNGLEFKQAFFRGLDNETIELCEILSGGY